jgi:hypothetical protein
MWIDFSFSFSISNIMEVTEVDTNKGHHSIICEGYRYRLDNILKSDAVSWRCTMKGCKARLKTEKWAPSCVSAKDFGSGGYVLRRLRYMAFAALLRSFGSSCVSSYSCRAFHISLDGLWLMSSDALRFTEFLSTCRSFFLSSGSWLCSFFCFQSSFTPFHWNF